MAKYLACICEGDAERAIKVRRNEKTLWDLLKQKC